MKLKKTAPRFFAVALLALGADALLLLLIQQAYLSLLKRAGRWTPYLTLSRLHSADIPDAHSASAVAVSLGAFDQSALAAGASWSLSRSGKLKGEWMRVRIGNGSTLVDPEVIERVRSTAGAIGYVDEADLRPGVEVLLAR